MRKAIASALLGLAAILHHRGASAASPSKPISVPSAEDPLAQSSIPEMPDSYFEAYDQNMRDETACAPRIVDPEVKRLHDIAFAEWCVAEELRWGRIVNEENRARRARKAA